MSNNLADVWSEVEALLNQNISIIPVRDKDEIYNGKTFGVKTPYRKWEQYQTEIISRDILWQQMSEKNTTAIAMVCGAISGNLEVIDFDVKYYPGIDGVVIGAIHELYPDILAKMRVHKTRSGGTHLVYRIANHEVPPSTHLAERKATDEELIMSPKRPSRCFIETRGTGGLATAPPSLGYSVRKNTPIQEITWEERCSIIELCRAYNEFIKEVKPYKPPTSEVNYYDENPFEHYNRTIDPKILLEEFGWTFVKKHGDFLWFTKPGGRKGEVHAGFNVTKCTFRIWSTDTGWESEKSYTPSTVLSYYKFNDDKSLAYAYLVDRGYGRIKPTIERTIARNKAMQGKPMPFNASPAAVEQYTQHIIQLTTAHPHGIFWEPDSDDPEIMHISRLKFKEVGLQLGFRLHNGDIVQIIDQFIHIRDERFFFDCMREYIKEEDPDTYECIYNATQTFLQKNGGFEISQIDMLDASLIVQDTRTCCYKFYTNGYVLITSESFDLCEYNTLPDKLIWHEKVQQRKFVCSQGNGGLYTDFLRLACDLDNHADHIMRVIGWLSHDYKDSTTGYIITLVEQCADPKDGGGSGKNLFCELLKNTITYKSIPAGQKKLDEKLLQSWNGERLFVLSDAKKDFDFEILKEPASGNAIVKKLFKDEKSISNKESPKFIVLTNFSYEITDGGLKRRIIGIEFTNFFTNCGGVDKHFGKYFPDDWSDDDWADFDTFICQSIQKWISCGLRLERLELTLTGWEKQFVQTYGIIITEFIQMHWDEFKIGNFISNATFNKMLEDFMIENNYSISKHKPTTFKLNKAFDEWCSKNNYSMAKNKAETINGFYHRGRKFYDNNDEVPF